MGNYWEYLSSANRQLTMSSSGNEGMLDAATLAALLRVFRRELALRYEKKSLVFVDDDTQILFDRWDRKEVWVTVPHLDKPFYYFEGGAGETQLSPRQVSIVPEKEAFSLSIPSVVREARLARLYRAYNIADDALKGRVRDPDRIAERLDRAGVLVVPGSQRASQIEPIELSNGFALVIADDATFSGAIKIGVSGHDWFASALDSIAGSVRGESTDRNPVVQASITDYDNERISRNFSLDRGATRELQRIQSWLRREIEREEIRTGMAEYDVAISYAREDQDVAKAVADGLILRGYRVYYDAYEQARAWGKDLYRHLADVYGNRASFCVILISKHYARKVWTGYELQQAHARALRESGNYILPVRLDETTLPDPIKDIVYVDSSSVSLYTLVDMIIERVEELS